MFSLHFVYQVTPAFGVKSALEKQKFERDFVEDACGLH